MSDPLKNFDLFIEPSPKRVRVKFAGQVVADTRRALLVHERGCAPVYYFPVDSVRADLLHPSDLSTRCAAKGAAVYWHLKLGEHWSDNAVWRYPDPTTEAGAALQAYYAFDWKAVDEWFEEEEQLFLHPHARDPYKRIEAVRSSRHVRVVVDGHVVASSRHPVVVFETGGPTRYYLPEQDIKTEYLSASQRVTHCPYRGEAKHWSLTLQGRSYPDIAWAYPSPGAGLSKIAGMRAFFQERVDYFEVDGEKLAEEDWGPSLLDYFGRGRFFTGRDRA